MDEDSSELLRIRSKAGTAKNKKNRQFQSFVISKYFPKSEKQTCLFDEYGLLSTSTIKCDKTAFEYFIVAVNSKNN